MVNTRFLRKISRVARRVGVPVGGTALKTREQRASDPIDDTVQDSSSVDPVVFFNQGHRKSSSRAYTAPGDLLKRENADVYPVVRGHRVGGTESAALRRSSVKGCEWLEVFGWVRATTAPEGANREGN